MNRLRDFCAAAGPRRSFRRGVAAALSVAATLAMVHSAPAAARASRSVSANPDSNGVSDFSRARAGAPLWLAPTSGNAAQQLLQLLSTAKAQAMLGYHPAAGGTYFHPSVIW